MSNSINSQLRSDRVLALKLELLALLRGSDQRWLTLASGRYGSRFCKEWQRAVGVQFKLGHYPHRCQLLVYQVSRYNRVCSGAGF